MEKALKSFHPDQSSRTIAELFDEEQPLLIQIKAMFDGYVETMRRVSSICLINIYCNLYSAMGQSGGFGTYHRSLKTNNPYTLSENLPRLFDTPISSITQIRG